MNSSRTCVRKPRRKVINIRSRKMSASRSQTPLSRVAATYKERMKVISKTNKELASALQDARCAVTSKENLLKGYQGQFNNMMFARIKMLEMHSNLKSFMKDFDQVLLLLKTDNTKWPLFGDGLQIRNEFKKKMNNMVESVKEASEPEPSFEPKPTQASLNLTTNILERSNLKRKSTPHEKRNKATEMIVDETVAETVPNLLEIKSGKDSTFAGHSSASSPSVFLLPQVSKDAVLSNDGFNIHETDASRRTNEQSGTPKINLSSSAFNFEKSSYSKCCFSHKSTVSPLSKNTKAGSQISSCEVKSKISKIPKSFNISNVAKNHSISNKKSRKVSLKKRIDNKETESAVKESNTKFFRRLTFVKNSDISTSDSMLSKSNEVTPRPQEISNEAVNMFQEPDERTASRRQTFVVKSQGDRRKTFTVSNEKYENEKECIDHGTNICSSIMTKPVHDETSCTNVESTEIKITEPLYSVDDDFIKNSGAEGDENLCLQKNVKVKVFAEEKPFELDPILKNKSIASKEKIILNELFDSSVRYSEIGDGENQVPTINSPQKLKISSDRKLTCSKKPTDKQILKVDLGEEATHSQTICTELLDGQNSSVDCLLKKSSSNVCKTGKNLKQSPEAVCTLMFGVENNSSVDFSHKSKRNYVYTSKVDEKLKQCKDLENRLDSNIEKISETICIATHADENINLSCKSRKTSNNICMVSKDLIHSQELSVDMHSGSDPSVEKTTHSEAFNNGIGAETQANESGGLSVNSLQKQNINEIMQYEDIKLEEKEEFSSNLTKVLGFNKVEEVHAKVQRSKLKCNKARQNENPTVTSLKSKNNSKNNRNGVNKRLTKLKESLNEEIHNEILSSDQHFQNMPHRHFLSSSYSDDESLQKIDFDALEVSPLKLTPVIRGVPSGKKKKVFVFNGNKRRSTINKSSKKIAKLPLDATFQSSDRSDLNKENISDASLIRIQSIKRPKKSVNFSVSNQIVNACDAAKDEQYKMKTKKVKSKVKKQLPVNTFVVEAEIHPPPRFAQEENEPPPKLDNLRLSVVLSDVFQSEEAELLNMPSDKDAFLKGRTSFPLKIPLSDNSRHVKAAVDDLHTEVPVIDLVSEDSVDWTVKRRTRKTVTYREPALNKKLRRN